MPKFQSCDYFIIFANKNVLEQLNEINENLNCDYEIFEKAPTDSFNESIVKLNKKSTSEILGETIGIIGSINHRKVLF